MSTTPTWPSLYNPGLEILHIEHRPPTQPGGAYLHSAGDIFRFTLYWTLAFYVPAFFTCGLYAFINYTFPPKLSSLYPSSFDGHEREDNSEDMPRRGETNTYIPLQPSRVAQSHSANRTGQALRKNERRSRVAFALLILIVFLGVGVAGAVIGSAVLGFAAMGLYRSAGFNMSTWIPFLLAVIQVLVGLLSVWPSIIEII